MSRQLLAIFAAALVAAPASVAAQQTPARPRSVSRQATTGSSSSAKLRDLLPQLFSFGECGDPLCLAGSAAANDHGDHFIGAAVGTNSTVINFITEAVGTGLSNFPISAASSGVIFQFVDGRPVRTATSAGPVFGERAQTLGRRRLLVGANVTGINYTTLRGRPLRDLNFTFTHQNIGGTELGSPEFENETIDVNVAMDLNLIVSTAFVSFGLLDNVDVSLAVPYVYTSLRARSIGQINPFGPNAPHYFGGDADDPVLGATAGVEGSATGMGDLATRLKWNLSRSARFGLSVLGDARFATGDEEDLLGAGHASYRGLLIASSQFGTFSPHVNLGYVARGGDYGANGVLATVGFDQLLAPWATLAADIITESPVGDNSPPLPEAVTFDVPFRRTIVPTDIPQVRDRYANLSLGVKFVTQNGVLLVSNAIFPLQRAGLQPDATWTFGLEKAF